jgi:hypothetical protein
MKRLDRMDPKKYLVKNLKRIGVTDLTFKNPGLKNENYFYEMPDNGGYQIKCWMDSSVVLLNPAQSVKFTGLTTVEA